MEMGSRVSMASQCAGACLLLCCISSMVVAAMTARSTYTTSTRNVCFKCPPGSMVQEDCKDDPRATEPTHPVCVPCKDLHYADKENGEKNCEECWPGNCQEHQEETQQCTKTSNRACRCVKGFFAFHVDPIDPLVECMPHTVRKSGEGEVYPGNATHDTVWERCEEGKQFVNASDPDHPKCQFCSTCLSGLGVMANCSLSSDTRCEDNDTEANLPPPPHKTSESSGCLGGAAICGLVYAGQVVLTMAVGAIGAIVIFCEKKRDTDQNPHAVNIKEKMCSRPSIFFCVLAFLPGVGICFATILLVTTTGKNRDTTTVRAQMNAELDGIVVVQQRLLPHDATGQAQPNRGRTCSSSSGQPNDQQNDAVVGATATSWSKEFIQTKVFNCLCQDLGFEWERFMHELPELGVNIEQKKLENPHHVPNLIRACLQAWQKKSPDKVTQDNICSALASVGLMEVIEKLEQKHARNQVQRP
ncbi:uncharacterized protein [Littorina saxatilis]|uniref:Uncharacterized protein n=1 Tax=Littorina saxatilis TaxID=31220 RepID=A0AAN9G476_9CAEN